MVINPRILSFYERAVLVSIIYSHFISLEIDVESQAYLISYQWRYDYQTDVALSQSPYLHEIDSYINNIITEEVAERMIDTLEN